MAEDTLPSRDTETLAILCRACRGLLVERERVKATSGATVRLKMWEIDGEVKAYHGELGTIHLAACPIDDETDDPVVQTARDFCRRHPPGEGPQEADVDRKDYLRALDSAATLVFREIVAWYDLRDEPLPWDGDDCPPKTPRGFNEIMDFLESKETRPGRRLDVALRKKRARLSMASALPMGLGGDQGEPGSAGPDADLPAKKASTVVVDGLPPDATDCEPAWANDFSAVTWLKHQWTFSNMAACVVKFLFQQSEKGIAATKRTVIEAQTDNNFHFRMQHCFRGQNGVSADGTLTISDDPKSDSLIIRCRTGFYQLNPRFPKVAVPRH